MHRKFRRSSSAIVLSATLALTLAACDEDATRQVAFRPAGTEPTLRADDRLDSSGTYFGERFAQAEAALAQQPDETPAAPTF